jgi:hypothetical protein
MIVVWIVFDHSLKAKRIFIETVCGVESLNFMRKKPVSVAATKAKRLKTKLRKIRGEILKHLDETAWLWNSRLSNLLDQIDSQIFGMDRQIHERK